MKFWIILGALLWRAMVLASNSPAQLSSIAAPALNIVQEGGQLRIEFTGTLQAAGTVTGPWIDLTNTAPPYIGPATGPGRFYRSREQVSIFSTNSVVELAMTGPLQQHFELAFAGMPDGIFPPVREKPYFDGEIRMTVNGQEIPVSLRVRGNSSLQECPFPKLKFKVSRENRVGTPFFDAREVKVGTHCAEGGRGPIGRLREQIAVYREAMAYEVMDLLGFVTPRIRRARIEYHDTTPTNGVSEVGWELTRDAFILEDIEVVAERLGGRALDDEEITVLTNANFNEQLVTDLRVLHVLLGNWDYVLAKDGRGIWNTDVIELANKEMFPVAADFDLSSFVTEEVRLSVPWDYRPELADIDRQARYSLEQIQKSVPAAVFSAANTRFVERRAALESHVNVAVVDPVGRTNALRHLTAFYDALAAVAVAR